MARTPTTATRTAATQSTTIKVPADLRDRLNARARNEGGTVAQVIEGLLAESDRVRLFDAIRARRDSQTPEERAELAAEYSAWERASLGDLERSEPPYG
jgi:hypothetical protein